MPVTGIRAAGIAISAMAIMACGVSALASTLDAIKKRGELLAGVRSDQPPVGYYDANGNLTGFCVDLANAVGKKLGVKVTLIPVTGQTRIPLLLNERIDAEFGSTTPTKERNEVVDFTLIINWDALVPLVHKGSSKKLKDYRPPKKVGYIQAGYRQPLMKELGPDGDVVVFPDFSSEAVALLNKKIDVGVFVRYAAYQWASKYPDQLEVGEAFFEDPQAILVRQNDSRWRNYLNWTLQELWADGSYQKMYEKHFGYPPPFSSIWSEKGLQPGVVGQ